MSGSNLNKVNLVQIKLELDGDWVVKKMQCKVKVSTLTFKTLMYFVGTLDVTKQKRVEGGEGDD